jgi:hypothetical protein
MDVERINNLNSLQQNYPCGYFYIVKQVDNQLTRNLLNWYSINIIKFIKKTKNNDEVEGGLGMSNLSSNPTLVCKLEYFDKI